MKIVGIVAEYNPFHLGHAYQIQYVKETLGADAVVAVMSGSFTQRGTLAIFDKYSRAEAAISCGVDLVLELPVIFATASAEGFASGALKVLHTTGIVDSLVFGCETPDLDLFKQTASILINEPDEYQTILKENLSKGVSFAKARSEALHSLGISKTTDQPNDILALEYIKAIQKNHYNIAPIPMQRIGGQYHDDTIDRKFASASALRKAIADGDIEAFYQKTPNECQQIYKNLLSTNCFLMPSNIDGMLSYALLSQDDFSIYADCTDEISKKINKEKGQYINYASFCDQLKSKNLTHSRISRVLNHILLDITSESFQVSITDAYVPYLRVLASNSTGASLLSEIKKRGHASTITSPKELSHCPMLDKDVFAANLHRTLLAQKTHQLLPNEYNHQFRILP